jgi:selenocysteine lyase/cysteine desulfurase
VSVERFRAAFDPPANIALNNAGIARCARPAVNAVKDMAELMAQGGQSFPAEYEVHENARTTFGRLVGTDRGLVSMMHTCAAALSQVALGMPMAEGDEVVTWDQEYPSNAYPWYVATERVGGRVVVVDSEDDLDVDTARLVDAIGDRTRAVAISWVQFQTGALTELAPVAEACRKHDAWLVVDVAQGLGMLPLDMKAAGVDVVCGATHKWLVGPMGHGFLAFADKERLLQVTPLEHGAITYGTPDELTEPGRAPRRDGRRFEPGTPLLLGAAGGAAGAELVMECGIDALRVEALRLADRLREGALAQGERVLGTRAGQWRSPITTVVPRGDLAKACARLDEAGVSYGPRAGGVRLSPHAYNTDDEIDQVLALLAESAS